MNLQPSPVAFLKSFGCKTDKCLLKFPHVKIILTLKEVKRMRSITEELAKKIEELPDTDKAMLVDMILAKLDQPDVELDKI